MAQVTNRENITISIGEYQKDGATKQRYKTIGELVTYQNDDGSTSQFGEMWGPTGSTKFNVYAKQDNNQQQAPQQNGGYQQQPQQQQQQAPQQQQQGGYQNR
jgi:hypothetical protein